MRIKNFVRGPDKSGLFYATSTGDRLPLAGGSGQPSALTPFIDRRPGRGQRSPRLNTAY
jgi:hypothetical protein